MAKQAGSPCLQVMSGEDKHIMSDDAAQIARLNTFGEVNRHHAAVRPDETATIFEGRSTTYAQFDQQTNQVANALIASGVGPGDHIAYLGKNSDHYFQLFYGAAKMGAIMTPIGWRLAPPEAAWIAANADAKLAFIGPEVVEGGKAIQTEAAATLAGVIAMEDCSADWPLFEAWRDAAPNTPPSHTAKREDVALQLYTSGTTGRPKGAMLTHHNLMHGLAKVLDHPMGWNEWSPSDVSLVAMPVAHIGGTGWGHQGLMNGALNVIAREFDPFAVLDFIADYRISKLFMVPAAMQIVVRQPRAQEVDFSCLKYIMYGASPIPLDLLRECMDTFKCGFCQQYGMTETTGTIAYLPPEDHDPKGNTRMRSAGKASPGTVIKVVDDDGNTVAPGVTGEVCIQSESNMKGYWKLPDATAETMVTGNWIKTGDAGYMDEDGYVYIMDRVKDMIVSGAENVYPAEVESAIYGHPAVAEVAVIGVPDEKWGEAVKAIVVLKPDAAPDPDSIIEFARTRIAAFKAPKTVDFIDILPRNASGKILRKDLRAPFWAGKTRMVN